MPQRGLEFLNLQLAYASVKLERVSNAHEVVGTLVQTSESIFVGCQYNDASGKPTISPFWPTGTTATDIIAWVVDDPETLFEVQYSNPGTPGVTTMQTAVGEECDWVVASPGGSTQTGISSTQLGVIQATSGQFQITGFGNGIKDSITDAFIVATVRINEHSYKAAVNSI